MKIRLAWMGLNFDDYPGFQLKITHRIPDIAPQIRIQESIKRIFNPGLFWAVRAAERKKPSQVCYF